MALPEQTRQVRENRIAYLRRRISAFQMEANTASQHAQKLWEYVSDLRDELWLLEDNDPGTESD